MTRSLLSGLILALMTGAVATGGGMAQADEQSPFSLKPVVTYGVVGAKGEPASMIKRRPAPTANNGQMRAYTFGNQGTTASMVRRRQTAQGFTNVVPAGAERTGSSGRPASLTAR